MFIRSTFFLNYNFNPWVSTVQEELIRKAYNIVPPVIFQHSALYQAVLDKFMGHTCDIVKVTFPIRFVKTIPNEYRIMYPQPLKLQPDRIGYKHLTFLFHIIAAAMPLASPACK
jgi:hypothetical protein